MTQGRTVRRTVVLLGGMAIAVLAACGGSAEPAAEKPARERLVDELRPGLHRLASVKLDDGRKVVLQTFLVRREISWRRYLAKHPETHARVGGKEIVPPCLTLLGIDKHRRACLTPTIEGRRQIGAGPIVRKHSSAPTEVYGLSSADVARVSLGYEVAGSPGEEPAVLLRVTDAEALARSGIRKPFGYFFAELPSDVSSVRAVAWGSDGRRLGTASFDRLLREAFPKGLRAFIEGPFKLPASDRRAGGPTGD